MAQNQSMSQYLIGLRKKLLFVVSPDDTAFFHLDFVSIVESCIGTTVEAVKYDEEGILLCSDLHEEFGSLVLARALHERISSIGRFFPEISIERDENLDNCVVNMKITTSR